MDSRRPGTEALTHSHTWYGAVSYTMGLGASLRGIGHSHTIITEGAERDNDLMVVSFYTFMRRYICTQSEWLRLGEIVAFTASFSVAAGQVC